MRGVLELLEEAGDDKGDLLADVDRVVADPPVTAARSIWSITLPLTIPLRRWRRGWPIRGPAGTQDEKERE